MIPSAAKSTTGLQLLEAKNCANTAQATGGWIDCRGYVGTFMVTQTTGAITGTLAGALLTSNASNGAGNTAMTFDDGNNFASVSAANNIQTKTVDVNKCSGWISYVGTVGTGPVVAAVTIYGHKKEST